MGFDFSEFYNCEKNAACFVPPLTWNSEEDGDWVSGGFSRRNVPFPNFDGSLNLVACIVFRQEIQCPLVTLAGDAVADPNWLLGVGLQRGWNSALDAAFYADNVYNNKSFNGKPPSKEDPINGEVEWSEHMDNMMNLMTSLGNAARDSKLSAKMDTGMLGEKGPVVNQIRRTLKGLKVEPPVPQYLPPTEPWGRYKEFTLAINSQYKGRDLFENKHPLAVRELAIFEYNSNYVDRGALLKRKITRPTAVMLTWPKRFECSAFWRMMDLLEIDGKPAPGKKATGVSKVEEKDDTPPPEEAVSQIAKRKSTRLRESIVLQATSGPAPTGLDKRDRGDLDQLIFSAAAKGRARKGDDSEEDEEIETNILPAGYPKSPLARRTVYRWLVVAAVACRWVAG